MIHKFHWWSRIRSPISQLTQLKFHWLYIFSSLTGLFMGGYPGSFKTFFFETFGQVGLGNIFQRSVELVGPWYLVLLQFGILVFQDLVVDGFVPKVIFLQMEISARSFLGVTLSFYYLDKFLLLLMFFLQCISSDSHGGVSVMAIPEEWSVCTWMNDVCDLSLGLYRILIISLWYERTPGWILPLIVCLILWSHNNNMWLG